MENVAYHVLPLDSSYRFYLLLKSQVDPGGPVVIKLASGSEVLGFDPGRGRWVFLERKNPENDFLRKGSKAVSKICGT